MNAADRNWMYERLGANGFVSSIFRIIRILWMEIKLSVLAQSVLTNPYADIEVVKYHLARYGFMPNYHLWDRHGETSVRSTSTVGSTSLGIDD
ncbi:hypothetical protein LXL04_010139 [Taraxacum kok-saghyz]